MNGLCSSRTVSRSVARTLRSADLTEDQQGLKGAARKFKQQCSTQITTEKELFNTSLKQNDSKEISSCRSDSQQQSRPKKTASAQGFSQSRNHWLSRASHRTSRRAESRSVAQQEQICSKPQLAEPIADTCSRSASGKVFRQEEERGLQGKSH